MVFRSRMPVNLAVGLAHASQCQMKMISKTITKASIRNQSSLWLPVLGIFNSIATGSLCQVTDAGYTDAACMASVILSPA